jgi:hypothetical protein
MTSASSKRISLARLQVQLGCPGCHWADSSALYKKDCCRHPGNIRVDADGKCLTRKDREDVRRAAASAASASRAGGLI